MYAFAICVVIQSANTKTVARGFEWVETAANLAVTTTPKYTNCREKIVESEIIVSRVFTTGS